MFISNVPKISVNSQSKASVVIVRENITCCYCGVFFSIRIDNSNTNIELHITSEN